VPIHKWPIRPISALREKFNPRDINYMPPVNFFVRLDLDQICEGTNGARPFLDGHSIGARFTNADAKPLTWVFFLSIQPKIDSSLCRSPIQSNFFIIVLCDPHALGKDNLARGLPLPVRYLTENSAG
jgi:hypothetical protein